MADFQPKIENEVKSKVLLGTFWLFMEKGGVGVIEFVISWMLARFFLVPGDYTIVATAGIFISFANLFAQGSFNQAIIQRKDLTEEDKSSVFWLITAVAAILYLLLFLLAPIIAGFYEMELLVPILRVQSLTLIFDALSVVKISVLTKEIKFKKIFIKTLISVIASGAASIVTAVLGYGPWALCFGTLAASSFGCIFIFFATPWNPKVTFKWESIKKLFGFSSSMFLSNVINSIYSNTLPLSMEKLYAADSLGYYSKSRTIPEKIGASINDTITSIVFPSLSSIQDNVGKVKEMTRRFIVDSSFVMFAAMAGLIATAKPLILSLYGEKWAGSIIFMQFVCFSLALKPINSANLSAIKALGKGKLYLILEIIKNVLGVILLAITMFFTRKLENGLYYVLAMQGVISLICVVINAFPNKKLMDYSIGSQILDVLPSFLLSVFMCGCCYSIIFLNLPNILTLAIQVVVGIIIYVGGAFILKLKAISDVLYILKQKIGKK